jgi:hypothetical protein
LGLNFEDANRHFAPTKLAGDFLVNGIEGYDSYLPFVSSVEREITEWPLKHLVQGFKKPDPGTP